MNVFVCFALCFFHLLSRYILSQHAVMLLTWKGDFKKRRKSEAQKWQFVAYHCNIEAIWVQAGNTIRTANDILVCPINILNSLNFHWFLVLSSYSNTQFRWCKCVREKRQTEFNKYFTINVPPIWVYCSRMESFVCIGAIVLWSSM